MGKKKIYKFILDCFVYHFGPVGILSQLMFCVISILVEMMVKFCVCDIVQSTDADRRAADERWFSHTIH